MIGRALVPLLVAAGHEATGTTRSEERAPLLRELGAEPAVVDVYNAEALRDTVVAARPEVVIHELTDLPDVFHIYGECERCAQWNEFTCYTESGTWVDCVLGTFDALDRPVIALQQIARGREP